ncbi:MULTISPECIES: hypothetical protein [unclassified Kitasatospora]|uniref:hypothetical protein n=1 Tax=unclassified Kitasatospora TaxID=2633591 RepID=UPI0038071571
MSNDNGPERLPQRWALILSVAAGAGVLAFVIGGPLAGLGTLVAVTTLLHTVMA